IVTLEISCETFKELLHVRPYCLEIRTIRGFRYNEEYSRRPVNAGECTSPHTHRKGPGVGTDHPSPQRLASNHTCPHPPAVRRADPEHAAEAPRFTRIHGARGAQRSTDSSRPRGGRRAHGGARRRRCGVRARCSGGCRYEEGGAAATPCARAGVEVRGVVRRGRCRAHARGGIARAALGGTGTKPARRGVRCGRCGERSRECVKSPYSRGCGEGCRERDAHAALTGTGTKPARRGARRGCWGERSWECVKSLYSRQSGVQVRERGTGGARRRRCSTAATPCARVV
ncbi:hypothetical protein DFH09DRAFT_1278739, partial [Mycena vulgaris]